MDNLFGSILSIGHKLSIKKLDGSSFATLIKLTGFISAKYNIYINNKNIASIKQHIMSFSPKIDITTKENKSSVTGDIIGRDFIISCNGVSVAKIQKIRFKIKDRYKIDIFDDNDDALFLSIVIVIDNSIHN